MKLAARSRAGFCFGIASLGIVALSLVAPGSAAAAPLEVTGPTGAALIVNGQPQGILPLPGTLELAVGQHDVDCRLDGFMPLSRTVTVQEGNQVIRLHLRLVPLSRRDAVAYGVVLAGLGQHYLGRPRLGWALTALELGGLTSAIISELEYQDHRDDYLVLYDTYRNAIREQDIINARAQADQAYGEMQDAESRRNTALGVAAAAVVIGVLDAWLRFPGVTAGAGELPVQRDASSAGETPPVHSLITDTGGTHVGWTIRF